MFRRMQTIVAPLALALLSASGTPLRAESDLVRRPWEVDGVTREALVYVPARAATNACSLVFFFHGHGGTARAAADKFAVHRHWPEAICAYMQGLNTPGALGDPEGRRSGWQRTLGDQNDRDLKFFDAALAALKKDYRVDEKRIYATGHSNGGAFTYLLWAARGEPLAAVAPSAAAARPQVIRELKPKPVLHLACETDRVVLFAWQKMTIDAVRKLNGCEDAKPWGEGCTLYPSKSGTPVATYIHSAGHGVPPDVSSVIVKFFQGHAKP